MSCAREVTPPPEPLSPAIEALATRIRAVRFPRIRYHRGYDRSDVDFLLRTVAHRLESGRGGPELTREVARSEFHATTVRSGYDERSVDDYLDELTDSLRELFGEPPPEGPGLVRRLLRALRRSLPFRIPRPSPLRRSNRFPPSSE